LSGIDPEEKQRSGAILFGTIINNPLISEGSCVMSNPYGPWATSIDIGGNPQLSAFWRRRLTMLAPTGQTSPVLSRRSLLWLGAVAVVTAIVPTFRSAEAVAGGQPIGRSDAVSSGRIFLTGVLKIAPEDPKQRNDRFIGGVIAVDPQTGEWQKIADWGTLGIKGQELYCMHPDGAEQRRLTKDGANSEPRISPDGRRVLYLHNLHLKNDSLHVIDIDGANNLEVLGENEPDFIGPACWSPGGGRLAVVLTSKQKDEKRAITRPDKQDYHIEIMDTDGKNRRALPLVGATIVWRSDMDWR
jgi:hypothetical protein